MNTSAIFWDFCPLNIITNNGRAAKIKKTNSRKVFNQWLKLIPSRGVDVLATGAPIMMPAGEKIKGRVFNVIGDAIDGMENLSKNDGLPIHKIN